jgi:protein-disulfide isomerase
MWHMKKMSHFFFKTTEGKFLGSVGIIIVLLFGYYFYAVSNNPSVVKNTEPVVITQTDHVRGAKDGKVTLVEFGDFQCPACGAYEPIVRQVLADNKDILKISFRHFPLIQIHKNALLAAKASEAASLQGKFWEMHDILYDKQEEWGEALNARDFLLVYANTIHLDINKFKTDIDSKAIEDKILAEYKEGVRLGIQGTPTFFINGKKVDENPQNLAAFNKLIQDAAAKTLSVTTTKK